MKKYLSIIFLVFFPAVLLAQLTVVSTQPLNNATNVSLSTTISITFSEALDTNAINDNGESTWFSNIDSVIAEGYSTDLKTTTATVVLLPNHSYFIAFLYVKALSGATLTVPHVYYFTTGSSFAPYSVSGTVLSGSSGVLPEGSIVGLANVNIMNDEGKDGSSPFVGWTNVNSNGTYTVPNVSNGKYWIIAAKDVDHDGNLDPSNGVDVVAGGDSIIVNNAPLTNINLTFFNFKPSTFQEIISIADSMALKLPADRVLRRITSGSADTLGKADKWEFAYTFTNNAPAQGITIRQSGSEIYPLDQNYIDWIKQLKPITNYQTIASSVTVIANAENAGGKEFRLQPHPDSLEFRIELTIADQKNGWFGQGGFDTSKIYWGVAYILQYQISDHESQWIKGKFFLCDLATGAIVLTQTMTGAKSEPIVPEQFSLSQNFPNPFNPSTMINYQLPTSSFVTLKVYDVLGKEVAGLVNETKEAGDYSVRFDASKLSSGLYIYKLTAGKFSETKKMLLIR